MFDIVTINYAGAMKLATAVAFYDKLKGNHFVAFYDKLKGNHFVVLYDKLRNTSLRFEKTLSLGVPANFFDLIFTDELR
jgi:hypothetical protein